MSRFVIHLFFHFKMITKKINTLLFIFIALFFFSCKESSKKNYSFYYWRTTLTLNKQEKDHLDKSTGDFLYTRFFDLDKVHNKISPVGILKVDLDSMDLTKKIVPVVFITNRTWQNITEKELQICAENTYKLIKEIATKNNLQITNEIQIDSDWTEKTRDDFFKFLKHLKNTSKSDITCTIRLHQIKDKEATGVPPVSKGYLMCYSTSSPLENDSKNSIIDIPTMKKYLNNLNQYPLKLDIALPIYSWGIVTNHLGKKKIINALSNEQLQSNKMFKKESDNLYSVVNEGFFEGIYLSKGFTIKVEEISNEDLEQTTNFISKKLTNFDVIYYHLDSKFLNHFSFK